MNRTIEVTVKKECMNPIYLPALEDYTSRYIVMYGGAGSGKSYFIAQRLVYKMLKSPKTNILVARNVSDTHRDSTFALFKQVINKWKLSAFFKVNETDMRIKNKLLGNEIIFKGLDDSEKLKSVTFSNGELTDVWVEEASEIVEADFNQLDIRLRGYGQSKQIVVSFNPIDVNHWLKKKFFDSNLPNVRIIHTTYKDNKFLDDDYVRLLESYKKSDPYYYSVYCLGEWGVYGNTIFDAQGVQVRLNTLRSAKPFQQGMFVYELDGELIKTDSNQFIDDSSGYITIYEAPKPGIPYVIGGDTSGEGSDFFVAQVIDNITGKQVAVLRHQFDEDLYAKQVYCLGRHYNNALIAIESNFSTYPNRELERLRYPRLYMREQMDTFTGALKKTYGFQTTKTSRPVIIANLVQVVRESIALLNDPDTLTEMLTFVRDERGRPSAQQGAHDDCVMALAIAHHARDQQSYIPTYGQRDYDEDKDSPDEDDNPRDRGRSSWFD